MRGLATGRIEARQVWRAILKEMRTALALGFVYGTLLAIAAVTLYRGPLVATGKSIWILAGLLGLSLFVSMLIAAGIGSTLPVVFQRIGLDPAVAAGPFVTTSVDVLGSLTFLGLASRLLSA